MSVQREARSGAWAEAREFARATRAIADVELRKVLRDPTELVSRSVQPVLWLAVFGQVFGRVRGIPTGEASYLAFMTPGILGQSVLFSAIFYGIAVIWERDLGVVHKLVVSPAARGALVTGKALSAAVRGLSQAAVVYLVAAALRIDIHWQPMRIVGVAFGVMLGSAIFSTFSLIIACLVKTRERFMGVGQLLTMPLFFASNALYPIALMPNWLKLVAQVNPLTYLVDLLRGLMVVGGQSAHGAAVDFGVMALVCLVLLAVAAKLYPSLVQ
jgi:ABC-2 type transport system permease protein